jgi:hypothetical protein
MEYEIRTKKCVIRTRVGVMLWLRSDVFTYTDTKPVAPETKSWAEADGHSDFADLSLLATVCNCDTERVCTLTYTAQSTLTHAGVPET